MAHTYQWLLLPLLLICIIIYLIKTKNIWFSPDSQDFHLILSQIQVFIWVLLTKLCMSYDHHLKRPWIDGAMSGLFGSGLLGLILLSCALTTNTIATYYIYGSTLLSLVGSLIITLVEIWTVMTIVKIWNSYFKRGPTQQSFTKPIVVIPESVRKEYEDMLNGKPLIPIGWTQFSTTYQRGHSNLERVLATDSEHAFKIIDIKTYVRYYLGSITDEEESEAITKYYRDYKFLMQINHQNIVRFLRVDKFCSTVGVFEHLVFVTQLAPHSLHSYLRDESPTGVQDYDRIRQWMRQLVDAVYYLHCQLNKEQPISHMNIKPENVLLYAIDSQNKEFNAKLSECGLELYFPKSGQIFTDNNKYLISAPEYVIGRKITRSQKTLQSKGTDPLATDIYSLGLILVLLLKGKVENFVQKPKVEPKLRNFEAIVTAIYVDFSWKTSKESVRKLFDKKEDRLLVHLLKGMLERKADHRFDIINVKNHPWIQTKQK